MILRYVFLWVPMVFIAILNAWIREAGYGKYLGELGAHQLSTFTAVLFFGVYIWTIGHIWRLQSSGQALKIGLIWLGLTVSFEFLFGHYIMGNPWSRLLHDYNLFAGRVWVAVLLWITVAPYIFYRLARSKNPF